MTECSVYGQRHDPDKGPLLDSPRRVGKPFAAELAAIYSARLGRDWRVLYEIDEAKHVVIVLDIRHRSVSYRRR